MCTQTLSSFVQQNCLWFGSELSSRLDDTKRLAATLAGRLQLLPLPPFASLSQPKQAIAATLSPDFIAKTLSGTPVYTVSNSNNEFVLISDPNGAESIGLLCFRQEDAEAFLAQARLRRRELRSAAKVVPITLDQVYMLKVEGIAFRFLPDPVQIKNALELKAADVSTGFDGVPVFQHCSTDNLGHHMLCRGAARQLNFVRTSGCEEEKQALLPCIFPKGRYRKRTLKGF